MRRQSSLAVREGSMDSKVPSRIKRFKNGNVGQIQRKLQTQALKALDGNQFRQRPNYSTKQPIRLLDKIKMISRFVEKLLDKKQKQIYMKLVEWIQKQEKIRWQLEENQLEGSRGKCKELRELIHRTIQKQEDLIKQSSSVLGSPTTISNASGVYSDLIARQMSPKAKFDNVTAFERKFGDELRSRQMQEQLQKKDLVIKRLFQRIEKWGCAGSIQDSQKASFGKCVESIHKKLQDGKTRGTEIEGLTEQIYRQNQELIVLNQEINSLQEDNQSLRTDYNNLLDDRNHFETKYRELNEEFEQLVGEKIALEIDLSKRRKETEAIYSRFLEVIRKTKAKIQEIVKDQITELRNQCKYWQHRCKDDIVQYWTSVKQQIEECFRQYELSNQKLLQKIVTIEETCSGIENKQQSIQNQNKLMALEIQLSQKQLTRLEKGPIISEELKMESAVFGQVIRWRQKKLEIFSIDIYHQANNIDFFNKEIQTETYQRYFEIQPIIIFKYDCMKKQPIDKQTNTDKLDFHEIQSQTFTLEEEKQIQTESNLIESEAQTNIKLQQVSCLFSQQIVCVKQIENKQRQPPVFSIIRVLEMSSKESSELLEKGCQTQCDQMLEVQQMEGTHQQLYNYKMSYEYDQNESEIINMLKDAEDCLMVPEISILRHQIARYRSEIEMLSLKVRQQEKEKEDQNVFNFRL